jgi:hypothetical protein
VPQQSRPPEKKKHWLLKIFGFLFSGAIVVGGLFTYLPLLTIDAAAPIEPENPFSFPFIVTNDSVLPLRHMECSCELNASDQKNIGFVNSSFVNGSAPVAWLGAHEKRTVHCYEFFYDVGHVKGTQTIRVIYYPFPYFIQRRTVRTFYAQTNGAGQTVWLPQ